MKILHLTLKRKWFDLIAMGEKQFEYRKNKPYWQKRLCYKSGWLKAFDIVRFKNGYNKNAPEMDVEFSYSFKENSLFLHPENEEELNGDYFVIALGEVLEVKNWDGVK